MVINMVEPSDKLAMAQATKKTLVHRYKLKMYQTSQDKAAPLDLYLSQYS